MHSARFISALQFGWSAGKPPQYLLPLQASDLLKDGKGAILATDNFVGKAVKMLDGNSDETPRFLVIPNLEIVSPDAQIRQNFISNLLQRAGKQCRILTQKSRRLLGFLRTLWRCIIHFFKKPASIKAFAMPNPLSTQSTLHFDQLSSSLIALQYGYNRHVRNTAPRVADLRQACRDKGLDDGCIAGFLNTKPLFDRKHYPDPNASAEKIKILLNNRPNTLADSHRRRIERDYALKLNLDMERHLPLVVIHNSLNAGILHGGPPDIKVIGPAEQVQRPIWYAAYKPEP